MFGDLLLDIKKKGLGPYIRDLEGLKLRIFYLRTVNIWISIILYEMFNILFSICTRRGFYVKCYVIGELRGQKVSSFKYV